MSENMADKHMPIIENDYDSEDFVFVQRNEVLTDKEYADTSYLKDVWSHFKKNKGAVIGMIIIAVIILFAVIGPMISGYSYKEINIQYQDLPPKIPGLGWLGFNGTQKGVDLYAQKGFSNMGQDTLRQICVTAKARELTESTILLPAVR